MTVALTLDRLLRDQHAEMRRLLAEVRSASAQQLDIEFEAMADAIHVHWTIESRHLYPLLERIGYPDIYHSIEAHRTLCHVVADLRGLCAHGPHFLSALKVLAAQLEQHIVDEERRLLPFLKEHVAEDELEAAAREMLETVAEIENENWIGTPSAWTNHASGGALEGG
ncbi:MAG: hemerythrin protein [bacterium]|nr:hemerythrin protein [bacterium]